MPKSMTQPKGNSYSYAFWIVIAVFSLMLVGAGYAQYQQSSALAFRFSPEAVSYDSTAQRVILRGKYIEQVCMESGRQTQCFDFTSLRDLGNLYTIAIREEAEKKALKDFPTCGSCGTTGSGITFYSNSFSQ